MTSPGDPRNADPDYSPDFQDEYQRLWHKAAAEVKDLKTRLRKQEERSGSLGSGAAQALVDMELRALAAEARLESAERERDEAERTNFKLRAYADYEYVKDAELAERVKVAAEFLERLAQWDMLYIPSHGEVVGQVADAAYWKAEIAKALSAVSGDTQREGRK